MLQAWQPGMAVPIGRRSHFLSGEGATRNSPVRAVTRTTHRGGQGDDQVGDINGAVREGGTDLLKSRDNGSGNDALNSDPGTDTCSIDAGDTINGTCDL